MGRELHLQCSFIEILPTAAWSPLVTERLRRKLIWHQVA